MVAGKAGGARRWGLAGLPLLCGLLVGLLSGAEQARRNHALASDALARQADRLAMRLLQRLQIYQYGLRGARGVVASVGREGVTRALFARYSATRDLAREFPGARGIGLIWRVAPAEAATFVARARAEGPADFQLRSLGEAAAEHYVIQYIEPIARNGAAIGLDIASEPHRRAAAERALRSGEATLTAPITLVQASGDVSQAFLLLLPVYRDGAVPDAEAARVRDGIGWSYAPLLMPEILASLQPEADGLHLVVRDIEAPETAVYASPVVAAESLPPVLLEREVYGRRWRLQVGAQPGFLRSQAPLAPGTVALATGAATLLGTALLLLLRQTVRRRREQEAREASALRAAADRLEREVAARTADLRKANGALQAVLDGASEVAIIAAAPDGIITLFNRGAERMLGYRADELVGVATPACFHDADEVRQRALAISAETGVAVDGFRVFVQRAEAEGAETREWTYVRKDGRRLPVQLSVTTLRDEGGRIIGYLGIALDISERRRVERMKNEFVATVSHELRTPLTAIAGALRLLQAGMPAPLPEASRPLIEMTARNAQRLAALINDLLDIEKLSDGQLVLNTRVQRLLPIIEAAIDGNRTYGVDRDIQLVLEHADPAACADVDAGRLLQVLANLLSNAIKFSPDGGRVRLAMTIDGATVHLRVSDEGAGVPADFRDRLFERFAQHDSSDSRARGGTGLGLAISRELMRRMGGDLVLLDDHGPGSTFEIRLPARAEEDAPPAG